jgi:hypothetical protein
VADQRDPLAAVWEVVHGHGATSALREPEYVDVDWRDEYANFYATTFRSHPDRGERLHFWSDLEYLGYVVIRPVRGRPVSRTMIKPPERLSTRIAVTTVSVAQPYGQAHPVEAAPYISQDLQYGRCAHATIWMVAYFHALQNQSPRRRMSDIVAAAASRHELDRLVPSPGLTLGQVATALRQLGLPAVVYRCGQEPAGESMESIVIRYLNSSLPIILGTFPGSGGAGGDPTTLPGHMTVLIGCGYDEQGRFFVVRHDDMRGPYRTARMHDDVAGQWHTLFLPLPGKIYLVGEVLTGQSDRVFRRLLSRAPDEVRTDIERRRTRIRTYVIDAAEYKERVFSRLPEEIAGAHAQAPTSHWIWVAELQDADVAERRDAEGLPATRETVLAELAIDATSDATDLNWLFGNFPGMRLSWTGDGELRPTRTGGNEVGLYETGTALAL